ncbi:hypothetical protein Cgig2_023021 [Carnegiea gigantea]|uniref:Reverse transcriptase zinc-binding domain-containing protein n=1 Tax=Carnegiea gigantea TaxID=171969 RepID=A0A9Q1K8H5_9CARY|nr:hypothetical protein Cgig2_023021 [Carnegiea gigantea]
MLVARPGASNVWQGITANAANIHKGASMSLGNGRKTLFWDHNWALNTSLSTHAIKEIPLNIQDTTVEKMWSQHQGWRWDRFAEFLPQDILERIESQSIVPEEDNEDKLFWNGTTHGGFSIKSTLKIIRNDQEPTQRRLWELVWSLPEAHRIRVFIWLVVHDKVMTNVNRVSRHIAEDPSYKVCEAKEEDLVHILRDCPPACLIWKTSGSSTEPNWPIKFAIATWWLRWRNARVFNQEGMQEDVHRGKLVGPMPSLLQGSESSSRLAS